MICIITGNKKLATELALSLNNSGVQCRIVDVNSEELLTVLYESTISGAIVDSLIPNVPANAWLDVLGALGRRIPVIVLESDLGSSIQFGSSSRNSELLTSIQDVNVAEIVGLLRATGVVETRAGQAMLASIPLYHTQVALHMLKSSGAISMLTINASGFRRIAIDFGVEAYQKLQDTFQNIIDSMWGSPGCFRKTDTVMRRSTHSNTYYVFLEQSRQSKTVPAPGVLEKMADRISVRLQQELWTEIFKPAADRRLPDCIQLVPEVSIGHATALYNPCVDSLEVIEHLLDSSIEVSKVHVRRVKDRGKELMQTLIQTRDLLVPNYQAVFKLKDLTQNMVNQAINDKSIAPLKSNLYGFESLIRMNQTSAEQSLSGDHLVYLEPRFLRPDIMFALAAQAKVSLELDQVCLALGIINAVELPGKLMVNILPRNLLHIERLTHLLKPRSEIVFELSESEGVGNPKLMSRIREYVSKLGCSIAADDFGKGYASIERVIKLRPEIIKLDRSLVDGIHLDEAKRSFVEGIIKAAKVANSVVLAEGVEKWEELKTVQEMGVELIQGFLLHKPQPLATILNQIGEKEESKIIDADKLDSVA